MTRRLLAAALALTGCAQFAGAATDLHRVAWTDDPSTTATIAWRQVSGGDGHVMIGTAEDGSGWVREEVDQVTSFTHPSDTQAVVSQLARVDGLVADTAYYFQVCDDEGCSDTSWFMTAPTAAEDFSFVAGGDSRTNREPRQIGMELVSKIRPLFVLFNGDFTDVGSYAQWEEWLQDWQLARSADGRVYPIVASHGNHENDIVDMLSYIFGIPEDGYYALNIGGNMMRVFTLNSEAEPGVGYGAYSTQDASVWDAQTTWLANDAGASGAIWKVGNYHRPMRPHTSDKAEGEGRIAAWAQTFTDTGFDVIVESDTHLAKYTFPVIHDTGEGSYQDFKRDDLNGTMLIGEGSWGAPTRPTDDDKPWTMDSTSLWQFKLIHASASQLDIRTVHFGSEHELNAGTLFDPATVTALTQAEQNTNAFAIPAGLPFWKPLSGEVIVLPASGFAGADIDNLQLVGTGAMWRFLDDGSSPVDWQQLAFDDSTWATGNAQFGYGDGDETTVIDFGADTNNKYRTSYFRNSFTVADADKVIKLTLRLLRDDGAVVYINGVEALRSNMPSGVISASTFAGNAIGGSAESTYYEFALQPGLLQDGNNVIAVEVHQADASSSDVSFDMDLTAVVSNVAGTVPVATTTLAATPLSLTEIELSWNDAAEIDEVAYQLERKNAEGYWDILTWRIPADTTSYIDDQLDEGTNYEYRIRPYNAQGLAALSEPVSAMTMSDAVPRIFEEDFEHGTLGQMSSFSRSSNLDWEAAEFGGAYYAYMNGFGADAFSDDWLITPAFALNYYENTSLSFEAAFNFDGPLLKLKYSTDYDPAANADPSTASWMEIPECSQTADLFCWSEPSTGSYTFENTSVDISSISGDAVYFAFQYLSTGTAGGDGRAWEIDNIVMRGTYTNASIVGSDFAAGIPNSWTNYSVASDANWEEGNQLGIDGAFINGFGADAVSDDWLVFPGTALSESDLAALEFDFYQKYDGPPLRIMVSTNYTDGADPASADWTDLNVDFPVLFDAWQHIGPISLAGYTGNVHVAIVYASTGTGGGDGASMGIANANIVSALADVKQESEVFAEEFNDIASLGSFSAYSRSSNADWVVEQRADQFGAIANGFSADAPSDDWLISPALSILNWQNALIRFQIYTNYGGPELEVLISNNYSGNGDPLADGVTWEPLNVDQENNEIDDAWVDYEVDVSQYTGTAYVAFRYTTTGTASGEGRRTGVDNFELFSIYGEEGLNASFILSKTEYTTAESISFTPSVSGGVAPLSYLWNFGDGNSSTEAQPTHTYETAGVYSVSLLVTDAENNEVSVERNNLITVLQSTDLGVPAEQGSLRIATFNAYLNRNSEGQILTDAESGEDGQIAKVAEIIQRVRPDVILLNEFDYVENGSAVQALQDNYLGVAQNGAEPIEYAYVYLAESNTGILTAYDLNNDGQVGVGGDDAYGFGTFPGQYGMVLLSQYPIETDDVRTFQTFLWKDMPGALLPVDPSTGESWYSEEELAIFRLSSKSHWDVPVNVDGNIIHILASHPTPPVFDGDEDRNGKRNHDETRFWADYVDPAASSYIYDDAGNTGGLAEKQRFVIVGDLNASSVEGDATGDPISLLTESSLIDGSLMPSSIGAVENDPENENAPQHTADWMMRADYVLPSVYGLELEQTGVFWPGRADVLYRLVGPGLQSSDHRLVFADFTVVDVDDTIDDCDMTVSGDQFDMDNDGENDLCDDDIDGDGVANELDNCPEAANSDQIDDDGDDIGNACDNEDNSQGNGDNSGSNDDDDDHWYGASGYEFLLLAFGILLTRRRLLK